MGNDCRNGACNVYREARLKAAKYNDRLSSMEGASELIGVSMPTLRDYEVGNTKIIPVDRVNAMADVYNAPHLRNHYCKNECPIGQRLPIATGENSLELVTIRLLNSMDDGELASAKKELLSIAEDGTISEEEQYRVRDLMITLDRLAESISALRLIAEKSNGGTNP